MAAVVSGLADHAAGGLDMAPKHTAMSRWRITVEAHAVNPRWAIPARQVEVEAADGYAARQDVARALLREIGVPASWDFLHAALQHVRATELAAERTTHNHRRDT
jgi:hypothetical protein